MIKKILWIGPVINKDYVSTNIAVSPAANTWQINFLRAIPKKFSLELITYCPQQVYPRGPLISLYLDKQIPFNIQIKAFSFINLPIIKNVAIAFNIFKYLLFSLKNDKEIYIFTYNPELSYRLAINIYKLFKNFNWISILADDKIKGNPDITVFLSFGYFKKTNILNKFFFDGAIETSFIEDNVKMFSVKNKIKLYYVGGISKWTGITEFISFFKKSLYFNNIELHIFGTDYDNNLTNLLKDFKNIYFYGYVEDKLLIEKCKNADIFLNPRPTNLPTGENNFPSKLLFYLQFARPILSTRTEGLAPYYDNLLCYYSSIENFDNKIDILLNNKDYYDDKIQNIKNHIKNSSWENKINTLFEQIGLI